MIKDKFKFFRFIFILAALAVIGYVAGAAKFGWAIPGRKYLTSMVPSMGGEMANVAALVAPSKAKELPLPSTTPSSKGTPVTKLVMKWNSHMSEILANGGPQTTKGSSMEKFGVNMTLVNQDDTGKMREDFVKFCTAYAKLKEQDPKANPQEGAHFFSIMGSGGAAMMKSLEEPMKKLGLHAEIIAGSSGLSKGEDKVMGPKEWLQNPQLARGALVSLYELDGDEDLLFLWAKAVKVPINTNKGYFDNDALNILGVKDFIVAGEKYITGATDTRPLIKDGKPVGGKPVTKTVVGFASWTPVDVTAVTQKGGVVTLASTKEFPWLMPNITIGCKEWNENHREVIEGWLSAIFEAGDQVKKYPAALHHAAKLSAQVYNAENAEYWETYYKGKTVKDVQGNVVELGGSGTFNLAENLYMYGLIPEQRVNIYARTYTTFGQMQSQFYPRDLPDFPPVEQMLNTSYLNALASKYQEAGNITEANAPTYKQEGEITTVVAKGSWNSIRFRSGSAEFTPETETVLQDLLSMLTQGNQYVTLIGHTDNVGGDAFNMDLGQRRADAVKNWLEEKAPGLFKDQRVTSKSMGMRQPVADNGSKNGQAQNRRVEIVLGTKS